MSDRLDRFVEAQDPVIDRALEELRAGRKQSHWMWFVFPHIAGLGRSPMAQKYALASLDEARAYLAHPILGPRLHEATEAVLIHCDQNGRPNRSIHEIFGSPDDLKFHSSMTLFHKAAPDDLLFAQALDAFFDGVEDEETLKRL
ncbi:DUF1810 domain-containing protein [Hyphococcus luteus]|uniref:DUF1810 domain-containing protein n=1 Tax=Hyphococcus luteus TaxID=2058213 RepID=A0A2S7JZ09_9PROT|nr:DUF1810 domain-containing protein [Marinicaulis flavus]PQA85489.1 DUF1810 domain-containing protein [Marinicaulis flavus]